MPTNQGSETALLIGAFVVSLAAAELATRSFLMSQPIWCAFYLVIAAVSLLTVAAVRSSNR